MDAHSAFALGVLVGAVATIVVEVVGVTAWLWIATMRAAN